MIHIMKRNALTFNENKLQISVRFNLVHEDPYRVCNAFGHNRTCNKLSSLVGATQIISVTQQSVKHV